MCVRCQAGAFLATIEHKYQCAMCHKLTAFDFTPTHPTEEAADQLEVALIPSDKLMYTHMHTHTLTHTHTHTHNKRTQTPGATFRCRHKRCRRCCCWCSTGSQSYTHTRTHTQTHTHHSNYLPRHERCRRRCWAPSSHSYTHTHTHTHTYTHTYHRCSSPRLARALPPLLQVPPQPPPRFFSACSLPATFLSLPALARLAWLHPLRCWWAREWVQGGGC